MAQAELEQIEEDALLAADYLDRARAFQVDAAVAALSVETRLLLLHSATIAACDAALVGCGLRVRGSDGGHRLRIDEAERLLPDAEPGLFDRLDDARMSRNNVSYAVGMVPAADMEESTSAVRDLIGLVENLVGPQLPPWRSEHG